MNSKIKFFLPYFVVILLTIVPLAACGTAKQTSVSGGTSGSESKSNVNDQTPAESVPDPIVIKMADPFPSNHPQTPVVMAFQQKAVELSGGKIEFEHYPGGQLGNSQQIGALVQDGAVDLGYTLVTSSSFLPLSSVTGLPSEGNTAVELTHALNVMLDGVLAEEWEKANMISIYAYSYPPNILMMGGKKVEKPKDLEGLKIRNLGGVLGNIPGFFGATGVSMDASSIYEAMQKGVADGALFPLSSAATYHFYEVSDYVLTGIHLGAATQSFAMNKKKFNSLPEEVQTALMEAGKEAAIMAAEVFDRGDENVKQVFIDNGAEIVEASPETAQDFLNIMAPLDQLWLEDMNKKGVGGGEEVLKAFKDAVRGVK